MATVLFALSKNEAGSGLRHGSTVIGEKTSSETSFLCKRWDHVSPCSWTQHTQPVKLKAGARTQEAKPHEVTRGEGKERKPNLQPASSLVFIGSQQPGASWLASRTACKLKCLHVTFLHSLVVRTAPSVCQPPHSHRLLVPAQEES